MYKALGQKTQVNLSSDPTDTVLIRPSQLGISTKMAGVRVLNVSRVALQPGTYPSPGETIELSFFDSLWVSLPHMQRVFLYPDTADASFAAILSSLKSSLALMLPSFHPFAGKLTYISSDAKAIIDCSASAIREGVAIIVAESDLDIHRIGKEEVLDLELFLQLVPNITMLELPIEVFAVQVTRFSNGGVALGTAIHHTVADGRGLWQFMEAWASTCRTGSVPSVFMPVHDRAIIKYPEGDKIAKNFTKEVAPDLPKLTIAPRSLQERLLRTRRTFLVDASTIRSWKKQARHENPSTFVSIAARVLVTVASVRGFADDDGPLIAAFLTDCRSRLDPPIDDGYTGNCVSYCFASMTASEVALPDGFVPACIALKQAIQKVTKEPLVECESWPDKYSKLPAGRVVYFAGSPRFKAYETDFGWGKPDRIELASIDLDGEVVMLSGKDEGTVKISLTLASEIMDAFAQMFLT